MTNETLKSLLDLLARERACLLAGDLSQVAAGAAIKQGLVDRLPFETMTTAELAHLQKVSHRNGRLLAAALSGIKSVAQRLNRQDAPATTYDTLGRRNTLAVSTSANFTRA